MTNTYSDEQLDLLIQLGSEAQGFFDYDAWGLPEFEGDRGMLGEDMRAFLEDDNFGYWEGNAELADFKKRQAAGGLTNRDVLLALWGDRAFGVNTTDEDRALVALLQSRRS